MIKTSKLYLIRHAPVEKLVGYLPKHDPNAMINFKHIKRLAEQIPRDCLCFVSPLKRAIQTAEALSNFVNFNDFIIDENLKEQHFGDWSGKKISEVWKELKNCKNHHNFSFICPETKPPNGENFLNQCKRIAKWLDNFDFLYTEDVVVITHTGTIRGALSHVLGIEPDKSIGIEISNLSITLIEVLKKKDCKNRGGRFRILKVNQVTP